MKGKRRGKRKAGNGGKKDARIGDEEEKGLLRTQKKKRMKKVKKICKVIEYKPNRKHLKSHS